MPAGRQSAAARSGDRTWRGRQTVDGAGGRASGLRIRRWPLPRHLLALLVIAAVALLLGPRLAAVSTAAWPVLDTAATAGSLLATWMVARLYLENWLYWIVIDALSLFLYGSQGLVLIALLYAVYLLIAVSGYVSWLGRYRAQQRSRPAA